ncbi:rhodanese-like domain-containing protein [Ancylobacter sp. G4_0304]|uniref:rhodanese-like domain-containing protein n=1 Tax=Ancylobacter sp. G4_0304 TaxID=3114289 RepID=UPI0039C5FECC
MTLHTANASFTPAAGQPPVATLTPAELHAAVRAPGEIAVVDVREGGGFETGHVSVAVPLPLSEIELHVERLLPRRSIRLVVSDEDGGDFARRAAHRLAALGYNDVSVLEGGVAGWAAAGFELITGQYSLSKALGEFVERRYHTPRIGVDELARRIREGGDLAILDTRPLDEFYHISIPGGVAAPGAELLYRIFDAVPSPQTPIVVNCAGRTRAILGAQALRNAGLPNPIVSLENGTSAWLIAGLEPGRGATGHAGPPSATGLERARQAAGRIAERFGVRRIEGAELARLREAAGSRSLYLLDVRTPEEFASGHLPGTISAPGGQVVQTTDSFIGTRDGIVVLVDGEDAVRATITASWLIQLGLEDVLVYAAPAAERIATGPTAPALAGGVPDIAASPPEAAQRLLKEEGATLIDLEPALPYFRERRYVPGSFVARRSTLPQALGAVPGSGPVILTSADGRLAALAAADLRAPAGRPVHVLEGGTQGWIDAGLATASGLDQPALVAGEALPPAPTLEERRVNFDAYVRWGDHITDQLERDGLVRFRAFD